MTNALKYLLVTAVLLLYGCKGEDADVSATAVSPTHGPAAGLVEEPVTETEDGQDEESPDTEYHQSSLASLAEIKSVTIRMQSENPREGFRAEIEYEGGPEGGTEFVYEWKQNGNDLTGANEEKLEWREGFKKGDTITVTVTPYSGLGQGIGSAGGSFTIPNSPPVITSEPGASFGEGRFSYIVEASDPDGDSVDFRLKNAPKGMTIEPAAGLILWEYDEKDAGDYEVTVIVADSDGAESMQELKLSIKPPDAVAGDTD